MLRPDPDEWVKLEAEACSLPTGIDRPGATRGPWEDPAPTSYITWAQGLPHLFLSFTCCPSQHRLRVSHHNTTEQLERATRINETKSSREYMNPLPNLALVAKCLPEQEAIAALLEGIQVWAPLASRGRQLQS